MLKRELVKKNMKTIILICVLSFYAPISFSLEPKCPDIQKIVDFIIKDNLEEIKKLGLCHFDYHLDDDKALNIAAKYKSYSVEKFLLNEGLEYKVKYLRNLWLLAMSNGKMLGDATSMVYMRAKEKPNAKNWQRLIKEKIASEKYMFDAFGHELTFGKSKERGFYFCSLGRDNKAGGKGYDQDVCSDSNIEELIALNFSPK